MIVFSETEKYCRICGDIFVATGFYDDDIKDCHKCNKRIDKVDPAFDEHNNYYCDDCYDSDEEEDTHYELCESCNKIVSYPNVYIHDTNNYCKPCYKYIKADEAENPAHRAKMFRVEYNKLYEDCDINDFTSKNADNQEVYAVEVFHKGATHYETTSKHQVKYIMVPELTETCKNKMSGALVIPQYIVTELYPFIYGDEYDNTNLIYNTIIEYELRLYRVLPRKKHSISACA